MSFFDNIRVGLFGNNNGIRQNNRLGINKIFNTRSNISRNVRSIFGSVPSRTTFKLVSKEQARNMILSSNVLLIDVRSKQEYDTMHIRNAINIPVEELEHVIFSIEPDINKYLMVYCASGARSKTAIQILNRLGYMQIYIWEYGALSTFPYKDMLVYSKQ
ncbi:MAG: rhodanese-like domain-containing protein [Clostridia bacterium]|nr:rhodanese-like domain-containing protein [Clostridia bacterium]